MNESHRMHRGRAEGAAYGEPANADRLAHYENARVTIYYNGQGGVSDTGTVAYLDTAWLELVKDSADRLLIPINSIRIIKLLQTAKPQGDAAILLRPADGRAQSPEKGDPGE